MRILYAVLLAAVLNCGCKPKNKLPGLKDLVTSDTSKTDTKEEKHIISSRELIIGKWRMTDVLPNPTPKEKDDMINTVMEFTKEGKIMITDKGKTEEAASFTFSFDEKYLLSRGDHNELDTLLIKVLTSNRLVLVSTKDNRTLIAEPVR